MSSYRISPNDRLDPSPVFGHLERDGHARMRAVLARADDRMLAASEPPFSRDGVSAIRMSAAQWRGGRPA
jgi:hypothetical protein